MRTQGQFVLMTVKEFKDWLDELNVKRTIKLIQLHHTYEPSHNDFTGANHFQLLQGMKNYHVNVQKWQDIGQTLTIFPDGQIATCRSFELNPAGIKGHNDGAICIEILGNFDQGHDEMKEPQKGAVIQSVAFLCKKFCLPVSGATIIYHHWFNLKTGARDNENSEKSEATTDLYKTCPGTGFFSGNRKQDAEKYLYPLIEITKGAC